jgi:hypothetical protein
MFCYYTVKNANSNLWTELPSYIAYIQGYSKTTGRTYFRGQEDGGLLSTYDGVSIELTPETDLPGDIFPSSVVPGFDRQGVTFTIPGTTFTGKLLNGMND